MTIRVVLGEDNVFVREGVRALLDSYDDIDVVGAAEDAPTLLVAAAEHVPDVVVTDIKMPPSFQLEGIDCAHAIRAHHPATGVVVLSQYDDEEYAVALLGKGHSGLAYLLKDRVAQGDELVRAIREVHAGGSAVDPAIAARLTGSRHADDEDRHVLDMMSKGMGYAEMAAALGTTQEAVDRRVTELFQRIASGGATGADDLRRLHAAVVQSTQHVDTLRAYVPEQVASGLVHDATIAQQREVEVTVLFSDIRGFSALSERLGARDVADVIGRHLQAMAECVAAHGGTIDKFQGDAVMAVFGAPVPMTDHARCAVECALAMAARQDELNAAGWGVAGVTELGVGIGLNTGVVMAGAIGGGGRLEYTVIGDAVNVAQRLQSEATGGEIVAAASTIRAAGVDDVEPIGSRPVKGRAELVEVFRIRRRP
jgi:class 3 adenylate cyclase